MTWFTSICTYLVVWWVVLFAILPLGVQSHHEAGVAPVAGGDPGAPVDPKLKRKFITTTWVATIVFIFIWALVQFHLVTLPTLPTR